MNLNIGVIGTGLIGEEHINRITNRLTGAEIKAVFDINGNQAKRIVQQNNLKATIHENSQNLIHSEEVNAVIITSWGETHEELVVECLKAKKPVFCEKPLATSSEGCMKIVDMEVELGMKLVTVGYMRRFDEGYNLLKSIVDSGDIGHPLVIHCAHRIPSHPRNQGNMAITEASVHEMDIFRWLLSEDYVSAQVIHPRSTRAVSKEVQDPHIILLEMSDGVRIDIEVFINSQYGYDIECQVVGENGVVNLPQPQRVVTYKDFNRSSSVTRNWKERFNEAYDRELQEWIRNAIKGEVRGPSAWDGFAVSIAADACIEAKKTGNIIPISNPKKPQLYSQ